MANNPYVNKVQFGNQTLIDLTSDTVTADKLMQGYTAHDRTGQIITGTATGGSGSGVVWQDSQGYVHLSDDGDIPLQTKSASPSETAQTVTPDTGYYALDKVNVGAISSTYVGSGITRRSSSDLTASGATVTVPSGYYSAQASKAVASGTAGTPTATKGTVSNHAVSVTPSVTNISGYITGGTKTGTAVTVSASELVSGTYSVTSAGTKDVTNYASASVPSGTEGTPTATKGTVSNHSVSVTPSVTNSGGYITGSTKTGTAVTVSVSELVSGTKTITENGTGIDVSTYESVDVNVPSSEPNIGSLTVTPSAVDQVFTGAYPAINLGVLSFRKTGTSASLSIDLSEIEYGETYHIQCDSMTVGNDGQYYNYIKIDTDWVASENGTVPFEYISHANWNVTNIKLSKSAITVAVSTGRRTIVNIGGAYTPTDFIVSKAGTVDGYNPVTVIGDANLVPENIRSGVSIFGVTGTYTG